MIISVDVDVCIIHYDNKIFSCTDEKEPGLWQGEINGDLIHYVYIESGSKGEHYKNPFSITRSTYKRMPK